MLGHAPASTYGVVSAQADELSHGPRTSQYRTAAKQAEGAELISNQGEQRELPRRVSCEGAAEEREL